MATTKKPTKKIVKQATEIKSLAELQKDLATKLADQLTAKTSHRAGELVNPHTLGTIRKEIARLHTSIRAGNQPLGKKRK
ncbi:MAG: 50S ribosomal protein L29 [Candidatus Saccharimonas sp.]